MTNNNQIKGCGKELFEHPDYPELKCYCGDDCGYLCDECKKKMKTNNQIKEIEKGCGRDYCGKLIYHKHKTIEDTLCFCCKEKLKLLKQFQEEIKEVQGELKEEFDLMFQKLKINEIFKNKFREMK